MQFKGIHHVISIVAEHTITPSTITQKVRVLEMQRVFRLCLPICVAAGRNMQFESLFS